MHFKIYYFAVIMLVGIVLCNAFPSIIAQTNSTVNTFVDSKTGISFHYPFDWHIASKKASQEYMNLLFGNTASIHSLSSNASSSAITPVVIALPKTLNGASFVLFSEKIPFPISIDKYFENTKNQLVLASVPVGNATPVSIGNLKGSILNGVRYNIILSNELSQTQILFIKDSNGFIIGYITGLTDQSKNIVDINSIINSLTIKSNGQSTVSSGGVNHKNTTSVSK